MLRKYVQVDDDNIAICPAYVHGEVDAPFKVIPHENPETVEVGTKWDGSNWVQTEELVRSKRDKLLVEQVDVVAGNALRWTSLSSEEQALWSAYRTSLLNLPQQEGFPNSVVWPPKP
ncbi:phage tail assembly chaperone [bacterium]|nr:phage tail assembly chaperone [bacterium]